MRIPNTFNVEAQANTYLPIYSEEKLLIALAQYNNPFVLGGGSNMLLTHNLDQPLFKNI